MASYLIRGPARSPCPHCGGQEDVQEIGVKLRDGQVLETQACWNCIRQNWKDEEWREQIAFAEKE